MSTQNLASQQMFLFLLQTNIFGSRSIISPFYRLRTLSVHQCQKLLQILRTWQPTHFRALEHTARHLSLETLVLTEVISLVQADMYFKFYSTNNKCCDYLLTGLGPASIYFFSPMPPHFLVDFVVLPPGDGSSVTDCWGWDATAIRRSYVVPMMWVVI